MWVEVPNCAETHSSEEQNARPGSGKVHEHWVEEFPHLDHSALVRMEEVMAEGERIYGSEEWDTTAINEHVQHALDHLVKWRTRDRSEDHLAHAACRIMGALQQQLVLNLLGIDVEHDRKNSSAAEPSGGEIPTKTPMARENTNRSDTPEH